MKEREPQHDSKDQPQQFGKRPDEYESDLKTMPDEKLPNIELLDDESDPSVRPVVPQCRKCGETFSSETELVEHAKTCKGGRDESIHPHFH